MKKLTIATVITTLILSACAATSSYAATPSYAADEEVLMNCKQVHEAATITMQLRQDGVAYPDMLDIASDSYYANSLWFILLSNVIVQCQTHIVCRLRRYFA